MTSVPDRGEHRTGWGGRAADLLNSLNGNSKVSLALSIAGTNTFESANLVIPYLISPMAAWVCAALVQTIQTPPIRIQRFQDLLALDPSGMFLKRPIPTR